MKILLNACKILIGLSCLFFLPYGAVTAEEIDSTIDLSSELDVPPSQEINDSESIVPSPEENNDKEKVVTYAKGQLIVKLKEGCTLADIRELNDKYNVSSSQKVLNELPQESLTQLKQKLGELNAKHDRWYWQLEKDSAEYKDYTARIEQEKNELNEKIAIQEEMLTNSDKKQESLPPDTNASNLENVFVQKVPEETDILQMADNYRINPAVEYAEPNYTQKEEKFN